MFHTIVNGNSTAKNITQTRNEIMISVDVSLKSMMRSKKYYILNAGTCIPKMSAYLESIGDDSEIICDEIVNVANTVSINSDKKIARYKMSCCILHMVLLVNILLFIIVSICFYCRKEIKRKKVY